MLKGFEVTDSFNFFSAAIAYFFFKSSALEGMENLFAYMVSISEFILTDFSIF